MFLTLVGMGGMMHKKQNICLNVMLTHASISVSTAAICCFVGLRL